jgi:hypothetical protein
MVFERLRKQSYYKMWPDNPHPLLGLDQRYNLNTMLAISQPNHSETGTFETSPMFTDLDPESGLGGWGDPNNDYQITNGAFKDFEVSYPVFHRLRRQYTLGGRPGGGAGGGFPGGGAGGGFPGGGAGGAMPALVAPEIVRGFVTGNVGNFAGFQSVMEAVGTVNSVTCIGP